MMFQLQAMLEKHGSMQKYMESIKDDKEVLTDPNKSKFLSQTSFSVKCFEDLSASEIRLGKGKEKKVMTEKEMSDERILLGNLYKDKGYLLSIFGHHLP